jgi:hypothetical protein
LTVFTAAYNKPFVGDTAVSLVEYLKTAEKEIKAQERVVYAKAFSVVQSSGTGKSRMLTEVCSGFVVVCNVIKCVLGW